MITHIDKALAQQIVNAIKDVCGYDINFIDTKGTIFASTDTKRIDTFHEIGLKVSQTRATMEVDSDNSFTGTNMGVNLPVSYNGIILAVIGISGHPDEVRRFAYLAERITLLFVKEKELSSTSRNLSEKRNFILQSLINIERTNWEYLLDILSEFNITRESRLKFIVVQLNKRYNTSNISIIEQELIRLFKLCRINLYTYNYPNEFYGIIDEESFMKNSSKLMSFADLHSKILTIGIGKTHSLYKQSASYKTALTALKSAAASENGYADFDNLTLELILCDAAAHLKEEYLEKTINKLSPSDISILSTYYDENMSLANTSKRLYIHKNSLQYKLDKIYKITGYNPRKFKDAVILYMALKMYDAYNMI